MSRNQNYQRIDISQRPGETTSYGAGLSRQPLHPNRAIVTASMLHSLSLYFQADNIVGGDEIIAQLQFEIRDGVWCDVGEPSVVTLDAGDGVYGILLSSAVPVESEILPLGTHVRLVLDTGAGSSVDISHIMYNQRQQ